MADYLTSASAGTVLILSGEKGSRTQGNGLRINMLIRLIHLTSRSLCARLEFPAKSCLFSNASCSLPCTFLTRFSSHHDLLIIWPLSGVCRYIVFSHSQWPAWFIHTRKQWRGARIIDFLRRLALIGQAWRAMGVWPKLVQKSKQKRFFILA